MQQLNDLFGNQLVMGRFMNVLLLLLGRDKCTKDSVGELIVCVSHHLYFAALK